MPFAEAGPTATGSPVSEDPRFSEPSLQDRLPILENSECTLASLHEVSAARQVRVLIFGICDGIASTHLAWRDFPVVASNCSSEVDQDALAVGRHRFPNAEQLGSLEDITEDRIAGLIESYAPDVLFASAGTPCQQLSCAALDNAGFQGRDSSLFWAWRNFLCSLTKIAARFRFPCFWLWENVMMQEERLLQAEAALGKQAVIMNAAYLGHCRRLRI